MSAQKAVLTERQCKWILAGLKHLAPDTLQSYAEEKIRDSAELDRIAGHLFDCEECLMEYNLAFDAFSPYRADFDSFRR